MLTNGFVAQKSIQAASQMSPRVKVKKTSQSLQAEIAKLKEQLSREEQLYVKFYY